MTDTGTGRATRSATHESTATGSRSPGRYRLRTGVVLHGRLLVAKRPLTVTRLNEAGVAVVEALDAGSFRTPAALGADADVDPAAAARLLAGLHARDFLEWAPGRDPGHVPPVSVVVTARDAADHVPGCLDALASLSYPRYEVVLVDDGSTDGTVAAARGHPLADREAGRLRVLEVGSPETPLGIGASRNRGVAAARHDVVAFTDADCRPRPDWLADLVPSLAAHDVVGGRVRPHGDGSIAVYEGINSSLDMGSHAARVDPDGATPYLPTANLLARREVLEAIGFPDRNVAEDVGFCWRALDRGFDVVYTPDGVVEHDYRDALPAFAARRSDYGASEALLAKTYRRGERVDVPFGASLVALLALVVVAAGWREPPGAVAAVGLAGAAVAGLAAGARRYRRLAGVVSLGTMLRSRGRERVSQAYAIGSEVTRYYSGPLAAGAAGVALAGRPALGGAIGLAVGLAVAFPAVVEYAVERPAMSPPTYAALYLADHLGYQRGVYRGALAHRTLAHLLPWRRFTVGGPLASAWSWVSGRLAGLTGE